MAKGRSSGKRQGGQARATGPLCSEVRLSKNERKPADLEPRPSATFTRAGLGVVGVEIGSKAKEVRVVSLQTLTVGEKECRCFFSWLVF